MNPLINHTSTTSKRSIWPEETRDLWVVDAWESNLGLSNGKIYDDWGSALGAMTLGYHATEAMKSPLNYFRPATSLPWQIENDFAKEFCGAMGTEAVRFFKSGSDAVSCAVRLARAYTERDKVVVFDKSYHGTGDWFGGNLWTQGGIPNFFCHDLFVMPFDQIPAIGLMADSFWGNTAAIVIEPVPKAIDIPATEWLEHLRRVCDEHGIVLISDEVILGYRHSLSGYLRSAGIVSDLACYGKAMAQGSALSACTGREAIMSLLQDRVHFSGTNNGEPLPLQIAQWTLREYLEKDICSVLQGRGKSLRQKLTQEGFETRGLDSRFEVIFDSPEAKMDCTRFCFEHGILFPGFASMAVSHSTEQMQRLVGTLKKWREK